MKDNFAHNLRHVCDEQRSIAHVCRLVEINRQQFNKYLTGQTYPSKHNMRRITKFFNLTEQQLCLEEKDFEQLVSGNSTDAMPLKTGFIDQAIDALPVDVEELSRYEGYYYGHAQALGFPGNIIRRLVHIYRDGDRFYNKTVEHLWNKEHEDTAGQRNQRFKYKGVVLHIAGRIFITEYETLTKHNICHTVLFHSYRNVIDLLPGLTCGVGSLSTHMPLSTRVVMKFIGRDIDKREALEGCSLFDLDSDAIEKSIKERITNEILPHEHMLTVRV